MLQCYAMAQQQRSQGCGGMLWGSDVPLAARFDQFNPTPKSCNLGGNRFEVHGSISIANI
jgi:hypothetical protein